jgi:hypothetical protein
VLIIFLYILLILIFYSQVPVIYSKSLIDELNLSYLKKSKEIKEELTKNITS